MPLENFVFHQILPFGSRLLLPLFRLGIHSGLDLLFRGHLQSRSLLCFRFFCHFFQPLLMQCIAPVPPQPGVWSHPVVRPVDILPQFFHGRQSRIVVVGLRFRYGIVGRDDFGRYPPPPTLVLGVLVLDFRIDLFSLLSVTLDLLVGPRLNHGLNAFPLTPAVQTQA